MSIYLLAGMAKIWYYMEHEIAKICISFVYLSYILRISFVLVWAMMGLLYVLFIVEFYFFLHNG